MSAAGLVTDQTQSRQILIKLGVCSKSFDFKSYHAEGEKEM